MARRLGVFAVGALIAIAACTGARAPAAVTSPATRPAPSGEAPSGDPSPAPTRHVDSGEGSPEVLDLSAWPPGDFWRQVAPGGEALYVYPDIETMTEGVDAIVVGRVTAVSDGRPMSGDASNEGYGLGELAVAVEEVIGVDKRLGNRGVAPAPGKIMTVQFVLSDMRLMPRFIGRVPDERVVLFLANLGLHADRFGLDPDDPTLGYDYYTIQSPQGYIREIDGQAVGPAGRDDAWLEALEGAPFDELVARVRGLAGERR